MPALEHTQDEETKGNLPKGMVLDKDGKPCRLCTSAASWRALSKQAQSQPQSQSQSLSQPGEASTPSSSVSIPKSITTATSTATSGSSQAPATKPECPPDVDDLGRSTWTFLHSLAATYPDTATQTQQSEMRTFLNIFSKLYPCWVCAEDFRDWMAEPTGRNQPQVGGRKEFGWWMCQAHNEVNQKLGKPVFDCRFWEERWRDGWKDGRCD